MFNSLNVETLQGRSDFFFYKDYHFRLKFKYIQTETALIICIATYGCNNTIANTPWRCAENRDD